MAEGKWIEELHAKTPLVQAARQALSVRLEVVGQRLPQAVHEADADPEYVHQLRVGTRRADAALRIFRICLPRQVYKSARRRLRRLRRAAGAARDWDVFQAQVLDRQPSSRSAEQPGLDFLAGFATGQRAAAHLILEEVGSRQMQPFPTFVNETVASVRPTPSGGGLQDILENLAGHLLADRIHGLEEAAAADLADYAHLHQVRIAGKRLRYAMEVFAGCYPPSFAEVLYPQVEQMQEILGRANDSHVAAERLVRLRGQLRRRCPKTWTRVKAGVEVVLRFHQRRLPQERRRFLRWWDRWRRPESLAAWYRITGDVREAGSSPVAG